MSIEDWAKKASSIYRNTEAQALAQKIVFQELPKSGLSSRECLSNIDDLDKEYPVKGLIFKQKTSSTEHKEEQSNQNSGGFPPGFPPGLPPQITNDGTNGDRTQPFASFNQGGQGPQILYASGEHQGNSPYYCCNEDHLKETPQYRTFVTSREKEAHISRSHRCPFKVSQNCSFYYEFNIDLGKHIQTRHPRSTDSYCEICNDRVPAAHLETHMEQMHIKCPSCKKWYSNPVELRTHWETDGGACQSPITSYCHTAEKRSHRKCQTP